MKTIYENEHFATIILSDEDKERLAANFGVLNKEFGTIDFSAYAEVSARFQTDAFNEQKLYNIEKEKDAVIEQATNIERLR